MTRTSRAGLRVLLCVACLGWAGGHPRAGEGRPGTASVLDAEGPAWLALLPQDTVVALEIRGLGSRWPELRSIEPIARFQDLVLSEVGLGPEDVLAVAGDRALVALVPGSDGRSLWPLAIVSPTKEADVERVLVRSAPALAVHRARGALWVGPAAASRVLARVAAGDGTSLLAALPEVAGSHWEPDTGLIRGVVNPRSLRSLLSARVKEAPVDGVTLLGGLAASALRAERAVAFCRDVAADTITTDVRVVLDVDHLPAPLIQALSGEGTAPPLPDPLPPDVLLAASLRLDPRARLAWLRFLAAGDPRGPLRNLDFWIGEFEARSGRHLERDLLGALGERAWFFVRRGEGPQPIEAAWVLETLDATSVDETAVALRAFWTEHVAIRTLGLVIPRAWDEPLGEATARGITLAGLGDRVAPKFVVTDAYAVAATGRRSLTTTMTLAPELLRASRPGGATAPTRGAIRVSGLASPVLARALGERLPHESPLTGGFLELVASLGTTSAEVAYDAGALRLRSRTRFARASDSNPRGD